VRASNETEMGKNVKIHRFSTSTCKSLYFIIIGDRHILED